MIWASRALVVFAIVAATDSLASPIDAVSVQWGGASNARFFEETNSSSENRWGWVVGGDVEWRLPWRDFKLLTGMLHHEKPFFHRTTGERSPDYLSLPILLRRALVVGAVQPYVAAGTSLEFRLSESSQRPTSVDSRWAPAFQAGTGATLHERVDLRFVYVRDLVKSKSRFGSEIKNSGLMVTMAVRLPL